MIVLDTNVVSELLKATPHREVFAWLDELPQESVFTTAITQAEIKYGIAIMPDGKRKSQLLTAVTLLFEESFEGRVIPFDAAAADAYAAIAAQRRSAGQPISEADIQIAAITKSQGGKVATRNVSDFANCGIAVINPWDFQKTT